MYEVKMSYMQTWDTLLNPLAKIKENDEKNSCMRVSLPSIVDFDPSNFTSLDPLFLPFDHIQVLIILFRKEYFR